MIPFGNQQTVTSYSVRPLLFYPPTMLCQLLSKKNWRIPYSRTAYGQPCFIYSNWLTWQKWYISVPHVMWGIFHHYFQDLMHLFHNDPSSSGSVVAHLDEFAILVGPCLERIPVNLGRTHVRTPYLCRSLNMFPLDLSFDSFRVWQCLLQVVTWTKSTIQHESLRGHRIYNNHDFGWFIKLDPSSTSLFECRNIGVYRNHKMSRN